MAEDYYKTLGVSRDATADDVRKAYRKMALRYHPDKNPDNPEAEKKFKAASEAFEVISDPAKRKAYDERGSAGVRDMGFEGFQDKEEIFSHFGDLFGEFFGPRTQRGKPRPRRGRDLRFAMKLPLIEAALGGSRSVVVPVHDSCPRCRGSGEAGDGGVSPCPVCGGSGTVAQEGRRRGGFFSFSSACAECGGSGRRPGNPCPDCGGQGTKLRESTISVKLPSGIETGAVLRIAGQGEAGPGGGPRGDLLIEVNVEPSGEFERDGRDIRSSVRVPLATALLGGKVEVPTIRQKMLLTVPAGTSSDSWLRLRGQGIPGPSGSGDHLVRVVVTVPREIHADLAAAVKKHLRQD